MTEITGIHRLRMGTDGEGVSTLVAFYGCPLRCKYCINPHCWEENTSRTYMHPQSVIDELIKDDMYVRMTGGGVVFGGGEPLLHTDYILEVLNVLPTGWKCRLETSLNVPWECIEKITDKVNTWYIDIKDYNAEIYEEYTGCDNKQVLENLDRLSGLVSKKKIRIRIPRIPGFNNEKDIEVSKAYFKKYGKVEVFDYII